MPKLENAHGFDGDPRGECCSCGTSIPLSDLILQKFQRCYYCGKSNPFGTKWKSLLTPIVVITAMTVLTIWWTQAPL